MENKNSNQGFKFAMIALAILFVAILLQFILYKIDAVLTTAVAGLGTFAAAGFSLFGFTFSIKGINEKNTAKKIIGMIVNFAFLLLFFAVIVANLFDFYQAFG